MAKPATKADRIRQDSATPRDAPVLNGDQAGPREPDEPPMLAGCPVEALGKLGLKHFFLDERKQLIAIGSRFEKGEIMALFGRFMSYLQDQWPQYRNVGTQAKPEFVIDGFSQKDAQRDLIAACAHRGLFDPKGKVRGCGAHRGTHDELILHCGDKVLVAGAKSPHGRKLPPTYHDPGLIGDHVYPSAPRISHPHASQADIASIETLLKTLQTWHWQRGEIDAYLALCWLACASIGGVLHWRPHIWVHGPSGAGKTTLEKLFRSIMGDWAIVTENATEAALRQTLNMDTLAVMYDEAEPDEDGSNAMNKIVKLVRLASSGATSMRGGTDHVSQQFVIRSCFMFSSILHQELPQQDRNRITTLQLKPLRTDTRRLDLDPRAMEELGQRLRRRLVEQWPRFERTLLVYQDAMLKAGYEARHQDQYGTLLAAGDLLLYDSAPDEIANPDESGARVDDWVYRLSGVLETVRRESESDTERCLKYLMSKPLAAAGGKQRETVATWVERALLRHATFDSGPEFSKAAHDKLKSHGMKLVQRKPNGDDPGKWGLLEFAGNSVDVYLAIANRTNVGMMELFDGSTWRGGVWQQSLALVDGALRGAGCKTRFGAGPAENCILVPVQQLVDFDTIIAANRQIMGWKGDGPQF